MANSQDLYWESGPFNSGIAIAAGVPIDGGPEAVALLGDFLSACQEHYFAFYTGIYGIGKFREMCESLFAPEHRDNIFSIGNNFPDAEQSAGHSTIAHIRQGEILDSLSEDGVFENYHAKALVVIIYHLWDEYYRPRIADVLSVNASNVKCTLMGDIRRVRNLIIHNKSLVPNYYSENLEFLPQIWTIGPGELRITHDMVHAWMEQLNSMLVTVDNP